MSAAQTFSFAIGSSLDMETWHPDIVVSAGADHAIAQPIEMGISLDFGKGCNQWASTNLLYRLGYELTPNLTAIAGIGWGHVFTNEQTDHNYHTYRIGVRYEKMITQTVGIVIEPSGNWRTFSSHIGMRSEYGWWQFTTGIRFSLP